MTTATATINITDAQLDAARKEIREWFPGKDNAALRKTLREQLQQQVNEMHGEQIDAFCPVGAKLGYGILFPNGAGDERTQNFNADINKALGLA